MASNVSMDAVISGVVGQGSPLQGTNSFSQLIAFGDSNIDSGYFFTHKISNNPTLEAQYQASVAAGGGIPTSLGGVMNSVLLAQDFGLTATPLGEPGGTNYAASGATVTGVVASGSQAPSIVSQIQTYLTSTGNKADPNALYYITGGGNDVKVAAQLSGTAAQDAYMAQQANTMAQTIEQLSAAGARYIIIGDLVGTTAPGQTYITTLWSDLAAAGVSFTSAQISKNVIGAVDANPSAYGITNTVEPPVGPFTTSNPYSSTNGGADINPDPSLITNSWSLYATQTISANAGQTYLWSDDEHLSATGQQIEANYLNSLIRNVIPTVSETLTASSVVAGITTTKGITAGTFTYQWESSAPGQTGWNNIAGATTSTYVVQPTDMGSELRVLVSYSDSSGDTGTALSQATSAVVGAASPGNQATLVAPTANSTVTGGGYDILNLSQNPIAAASSAYSETSNGNGTFNLTTTGSTDVVSGIMQVQFSDKTVTVAANGSENEFITLLYQGALGRTPDAGGLAGWEQIGAALPSTTTQSLGLAYALSDTSGGYNGSLSIAAGFTQSAEFIAKYGTLTPTQFVTQLYANILDRAPDPAGLAGWLAQLSAGASQAHVLVGFADSAEAINNATLGYTGQSGAHASWLFLT